MDADTRSRLIGDLGFALTCFRAARIHQDNGTPAREALQHVRELLVREFGAPTSNTEIDGHRTAMFAAIDRALAGAGDAADPIKWAEAEVSRSSADFLKAHREA